MRKGEGGGGRLRAGCLVIILLAVILVGGLVGMFLYGRSKLGPYCEEYLDDVEKGEYKKAYEKVGNRWKEDQDFQQFVEFEETIRGTLSKCSKRRVTGIRMSAHPTATTANVTYAAEFEKGDCTITFTLEKVGGKWFVQGVNYTSDVLTDVLRCPHCGAVQESLGKFCSECGQLMRPQNDSDEQQTQEPE